MNRRELLAGVAGALAASVPGAEVRAIDHEPAPLLLVVSFPGRLKAETIRSVRQAFNRMMGRYSIKVPVVILQEGATLEAITDPRCKACREREEKAG